MCENSKANAHASIDYLAEKTMLKVRKIMWEQWLNYGLFHRSFWLWAGWVRIKYIWNEILQRRNASWRSKYYIRTIKKRIIRTKKNNDGNKVISSENRTAINGDDVNALFSSRCGRAMTMFWNRRHDEYKIVTV